MGVPYYHCIHQPTTHPPRIISQTVYYIYAYFQSEYVKDKHYEVPINFDLLTLDFDSDEYWVFKALDTIKWKPRVVAFEINLRTPETIDDAIVTEYQTQYGCASGTPMAYFLLAKR